jgi:hypothetical protein
MENYCCRASYDIRLGGGLVIEYRRDLRVLHMKLCNVYPIVCPSPPSDPLLYPNEPVLVRL